MNSNPRELRRALLNSVWALSGISLLSLILTRELEPLTLVSILTLFPLFYYFDRRDRLRKITWLENTVIVVFFIGSAFKFFALKESFLMVVADFLIGFLLLKCAFRKEQNDLMQMIVLSFFILLSSSTLALDFTFLFSFVIYVLAATWTLSLYTLAGEEDPAPHPNEPNQRDGIRETESIFRHLYKNSWVTLWLAIAFAIVLFVFFPRLSLTVFQGAFLGPVHQSGFSEKVTLEKSGKIFKDPTVVMRVEIKDPTGKYDWQGYIRGQSLSYFDGQEWTPGSRSREHLVKDSYRSRILRMQKIIKYRYQVLDLHRETLRSDFSMKLDSHSYLRQKIYLESMDTPILFGVPWMESVTARLPQVDVLEDHSISRPDRLRGRIAYEVLSLVERPSDRVIIQRLAERRKRIEKLILSKDEKKPEVPDEEGQEADLPAGEAGAGYSGFPVTSADLSQEIINNLQIPEQATGPNGEPIDFARTHRLARRIVRSRDSSYTKAKKIERYMRENYQYTLEIKGKEVSNPLEDFLFNSREGHCEYYASAMTLMLRMEGIPARIATGFLVDERNPTGNYYVVRSQDAHTWVEASIGGLWLEFDPTPRARRYVADEITVWGIVKQRIDYLNFLWNAHVLGYDIESQRKFARNVRLKSSQFSKKLDRMVAEWKVRLSNKGLTWSGWGFESFRNLGPGGLDGDGGPGWKKVGVMLLAALLVPVGMVLAFKNRKRLSIFFKIWTGTAPPGNGHPATFYSEMLRIFSRCGIVKKVGETPYEFAGRIVPHAPETFELWSTMIELTNLFYEVRFSGNLMSSMQNKRIRVLLGKLRKIVPVYVRIGQRG